MLRCANALLLAVIVACALAQQPVSDVYQSLVGPDFVSDSADGKLYGLYYPANVSNNVVTSVIQPITLTLPPCPVANNCTYISQLISLGIVVTGAVSGSISLAVYDDNGNVPGTLLATVTVPLPVATNSTPIKINEVNFSTPVSVSFTAPTKYFVGFIAPSSPPIAPMYFLDKTPPGAKAANINSFPATGGATWALTPGGTDAADYLIFLGFKSTLTYTPPRGSVLPLTAYGAANNIPTGLYSIATCPKGALCAKLA